MFLQTSKNHFAVGIDSAWDKAYDKLESWQRAIYSNIPNVIVAIVIFIICLFLSRFINKLTKKLLIRTSLQDSAKNVVAKSVAGLVITIGIFLVLMVLNLNGILKTILAGAGVMGLAVGLALQGTLSNTFSGIVLSLVKDVKIGDWISSNNYSGEVIDIDFRMTTIKDVDNNIVLIPNKLVLEKPIKNSSITFQRKLILNCGVGYKSDLELVKQLTIDTVKATVEDLVEDADIVFMYKEFADSAIDFEVRCMINTNSGLQVALQKSNLMVALKKTFDTHGINIPFPIRTLQMEQMPQNSQTPQNPSSFS